MTQFFGSGENLTDLINQRIEGIRILDEGPKLVLVSHLPANFVGNGVVATGIGTTGIITITDTTFEADAQQNLYAGTDAGAASDADTLRNIAIGCKSGCSPNEGDDNAFLGTSSGACVTSGSCNVLRDLMLANSQLVVLPILRLVRVPDTVLLVVITIYSLNWCR